MANMNEDSLEQTSLDWFESLGWRTTFGPDISPDGSACEREDYDQVVLLGRLQTAFKNINPNIPPDTIGEAVRKITRTYSSSLIENNRRFHRMLTDGVVDIFAAAGLKKPDISILSDEFLHARSFAEMLEKAIRKYQNRLFIVRS